MKYLLLLLLCVFMSCDKNKNLRSTTCSPTDYSPFVQSNKDICISSICDTYKQVWKKLFMEKNGITESYFNDHIEIISSSANEWLEGISFRISYKVKIDWAASYVSDTFIIKVNKDNTHYPAVNIPRELYLSEDNVRTVVNANAFNSKIGKVTAIEKLKFKTEAEAWQNLIFASGVDQLCTRRVSLNNKTGNLVLEGWAQYSNTVNDCIMGTIDLVTGETQKADIPCAVN